MMARDIDAHKVVLRLTRIVRRTSARCRGYYKSYHSRSVHSLGLWHDVCNLQDRHYKTGLAGDEQSKAKMPNLLMEPVTVSVGRCRSRADPHEKTAWRDILLSKHMEPPEAANNLRLGPETWQYPLFCFRRSGSLTQSFRGALVNDSVETLTHCQQTCMDFVLSRMLMMTKYKHATDISYPPGLSGLFSSHHFARYNTDC